MGEPFIAWRGTERDPVTVRCPTCRKTFGHLAWTLVNVRQSPELLYQLLNDELFKVTSPHCDSTFILKQPCLYLDPQNNACIYLVISKEMARKAAAMFEDAANSEGPSGGGHVTRRIVFDRHELKQQVITHTLGQTSTL